MDAVREGGSVSEPAAAVSLAVAGSPASPRTVLVGQLAAGLAAAVTAGDIEAARIAYTAIGRLLGIAPEQRQEDGGRALAKSYG